MAGPGPTAGVCSLLNAKLPLVNGKVRIELMFSSLQLIPHHSTFVFLHFHCLLTMELWWYSPWRQQHQLSPMSTGPTVLPSNSSISLFFSFNFSVVSNSTLFYFAQVSDPMKNPLLLSRWHNLKFYRGYEKWLDDNSVNLLTRRWRGYFFFPPVFIPCPSFGKADSLLSISILYLCTLTFS